MGVVEWRGWSMMRCIALSFANEMWMRLVFLGAVYVCYFDAYETYYSYSTYTIHILSSSYSEPGHGM